MLMRVWENVDLSCRHTTLNSWDSNVPTVITPYWLLGLKAEQVSVALLCTALGFNLCLFMQQCPNPLGPRSPLLKAMLHLKCMSSLSLAAKLALKAYATKQKLLARPCCTLAPDVPLCLFRHQAGWTWLSDA